MKLILHEHESVPSTFATIEASDLQHMRYVRKLNSNPYFCVTFIKIRIYIVERKISRVDKHTVKKTICAVQ